MNLYQLAGLGTKPGTGESLSSWLSAGPLPASLVGRLCQDDNRKEYRSFCPRCMVSEKGQRRWYTRSDWDDPRHVVCSAHGLPLVRATRTPEREWAIPLKQQVYSQLRRLGEWVPTWVGRSPMQHRGQLALRSACLEDLILYAITRSGHGYAVPAAGVNIAQWLLWQEGWPVAARPTGSADYQLQRLERSGDRLAVVASVWRLRSYLIGDEIIKWPPIPIEPDAYRRLVAHARRRGCNTSKLLERAFQPVCA